MKRITLLFLALLLPACSGIPVCSVDRTRAWVITTYARTVPIASPLEGAEAVCRR